MNSAEHRVLLGSAARTADARSGKIKHHPFRGAILIVNVTADPGTASVTPTIEAYDPGAGEWFVFWTAAAAVNAVGRTFYIFYPGGDVTFADATEFEGVPMPAEWRLFMDAADAQSLTYSASLHLVP